jgi:aminopeptidase N
MNARWTGRLAAAVAVTATVGLVVTGPAWAGPEIGSSGGGDSYYPGLGNGGYNVREYDVNITYDPGTDYLSGKATLTLEAGRNLSQFNLDLALEAESVTVDGQPAAIRSDGSELEVTPARPLRESTTSTVVVRYAGIPSSVVVDGRSPWVRTADGALAVGEPVISSWWMPCNDHPKDKAIFDVQIVVPRGVEALSNGFLLSQRSEGATDVWHWHVSRPMATYQAFLAIGQYDVTQGITEDGQAFVTAVDSGAGDWGRYARDDLARTGEVLAWSARHWGPYPFDTTGGVAPGVERPITGGNQSRPVYPRRAWAEGSNIYAVVHQQARQWFGASVSPVQWQDVVMNEGLSTFATWLWSEDHDEGSAAALFAAEYRALPESDPFWQNKIGDPGKDHEADPVVAERGAMMVQALRYRIGDPAFWQLIRNWTQQYRYVNAKIGNFVSLAERTSGQDLRSFFDSWLYSTTKPAATGNNGVPAGLRDDAPTRQQLRPAPEPSSQAKIEAVIGWSARPRR